MAHRPTEMQAWRSACEKRFAALVDHAFEQLDTYYVLARPDPVRPLVNAGLDYALDQLFDAGRYPEGMTPDTVLSHADKELVGHFETFFQPHQETMLLPGKYNHKNGASESFSDVDRTIALYSAYFVKEMRAALPEVGLPVPPEKAGRHVQRLAEHYGEPKAHTR